MVFIIVCWVWFVFGFQTRAVLSYGKWHMLDNDKRGNLENSLEKTPVRRAGRLSIMT